MWSYHIVAFIELFSYTALMVIGNILCFGIGFYFGEKARDFYESFR